MSEENKQNNSGKRRYFRRRRKGKKGDKRSDQDSNQQSQTNAPSSAQNKQGQSDRKRGDQGGQRKKRRSRRNRSDRRQRQQESQMPEAIQVPETQNYVEPTAVFVHTHIVRPAYRDAYADYRPEPLFHNISEERSHASAMDGLRSEINKQLDTLLGPAPEEEE